MRCYTLDGTLPLTYEKAVGKLDISILKMGVCVLELVSDGELTFQKFIFKKTKADSFHGESYTQLLGSRAFL